MTLFFTRVSTRCSWKAWPDQLSGSRPMPAPRAPAAASFFLPGHPNPDTLLYKKALDAYERVFNTPVQTEVLHAGLECSFIAEKYPHSEIISIGPTLGIRAYPEGTPARTVGGAHRPFS